MDVQALTPCHHLITFHAIVAQQDHCPMSVHCIVLYCIVFIKAPTGTYPVKGAVNKIKRRTYTLKLNKQMTQIQVYKSNTHY